MFLVPVTRSASDLVRHFDRLFDESFDRFFVSVPTARCEAQPGTRCGGIRASIHSHAGHVERDCVCLLGFGHIERRAACGRRTVAVPLKKRSNDSSNRRSTLRTQPDALRVRAPGHVYLR